MYTIAKEFYFSASHQLDSLPQGHPCARMHGHNYTVTLMLESASTDQHGFVVDYGDLDPMADYLQETFDHRHLNDVLPGATSAEHIAAHLYHWAKTRWPQVAAVRVSENAQTWAEYRQ